MDFPEARLSLPIRWFPFQRFAAALPTAVPDCHLVRTAIPFLPHEDSLGDFHRSPSVSLASFADRVSGGDRGKALARAPPRSSSIHPPHARQATSTHSVTAPTDRCTALQVHNLFRTQAEIPQGSTSVHKNRSPRKQGRNNHAIGKRPESASAHSALPPSTHPTLGVSSRHHGFHRYALQRIFRPSLGNGRSD